MANIYTVSKETFDANLKTINSLYTKTTTGRNQILHGSNEEISEIIYQKLLQQFDNTSSLLWQIEKYESNLNDLISTLGLSEELSDKCKIMELEEYKINRDDNQGKNDKPSYIYPLLYFYILGHEEKMKSDHMILKMSYVFLHSILDEFLLDTIERIAYLCIQSLGKKKQISYDEIFKCNNISELHQKMVDKELDSLGRGSIEDKIIFLEDRGVRINEISIERDDLILYGEIRNSITHSKGLVNASIISKLRETKYKSAFSIEDLFTFSEPELIIWFNKIETFVDELYVIVTEKFNELKE